MSALFPPVYPQLVAMAETWAPLAKGGGPSADFCRGLSDELLALADQVRMVETLSLGSDLGSRALHSLAALLDSPGPDGLRLTPRDVRIVVQVCERVAAMVHVRERCLDPVGTCHDEMARAIRPGGHL